MPVAYVRRRPDVGEAQPRPECAEPLEHSRVGRDDELVVASDSLPRRTEGTT